MSSGSFFHFWGKARPSKEAIAPCQSAAYHCLDVAACAHVLLGRNELLCKRLCDLLSLDAKHAIPFLTTLIALHDVGKFSKPFQAKVAYLWPPELGAIDGVPAEPNHDAAGLLLGATTSSRNCSTSCHRNSALMPLARAVFGHHGSPAPREQPSAASGSLRSCWARERPGKRVRARGGGHPVARIVTAPVSQSTLNRASYALAGLVVLADWIGSSQRWFAYTTPDLSLADYWHNRALPQAHRAVEAAGILPAPSANVQSYERLMGGNEFTPSSMQAWASKTEAALMLAHRAHRRQGGPLVST